MNAASEDFLSSCKFEVTSTAHTDPCGDGHREQMSFHRAPADEDEHTRTHARQQLLSPPHMYLIGSWGVHCGFQSLVFTCVEHKL